MSLPVDLLVEEHKLILQAVEAIKGKTSQIRANQPFNPNDVTVMVDFFRTFADRYHHGKEEGILFRALFQKKLSEADRKITGELVLEHALARRTVTALETGNLSFVSGNKGALGDVLKNLQTLVELYPAHIEKEDKHFFYPVMGYFSKREQGDMLAQFRQFNFDFTEKRYSQTVASFLK